MEQHLEILKRELNFFESLLQRAKGIALVDPYVSHALLEIAKFEYLNHDNIYEAYAVMCELRSHLNRNVNGDKYCTDIKRYPLRLALDRRLAFLDTLVGRRRNKTSVESLDSEFERVNEDYLLYLSPFDPKTAEGAGYTKLRAKTICAYTTFWVQVWDGPDDSDPPYCVEDYYRLKDEWEYKITCESEAITHASHDPVRAFALDLAKNLTPMFWDDCQEPEEERSKDDIAITTFKGQLEILETYVNNPELDYDKSPHVEAYNKLKKQRDELFDKLEKFKDSDLPPPEPGIRSDYVAGDLIEEYVRTCFTYGREYSKAIEYQITSALAADIMHKRQLNIKEDIDWLTGPNLKNFEKFRNTGSAVNDAYWQTMTNYATKRSDYLKKIPEAMDAALQRRKDDDELIMKETLGYVKGLLNKYVK